MAAKPRSVSFVSPRNFDKFRQLNRHSACSNFHPGEEAIMSRVLRFCCLPAIVLALAAAAYAAPTGLDQTGKPDLKSAGSLAFGPKGVLFVGDPQGAQIVAIDVGTAPTNPIGAN